MLRVTQCVHLQSSHCLPSPNSNPLLTVDSWGEGKSIASHVQDKHLTMEFYSWPLEQSDTDATVPSVEADVLTCERFHGEAES